MTTLPNLFDQWAEVYDTDLNPLLALEERVLPALLPAIAGAHVLDIGCGTGRWLQRLETQQPASLTGVDPSTAMLAIARRKLSATTALLNAPAGSLPVPDSSQDLVLASFVLSYVEDLSAFAGECARVLKPGGYFLLTDMHPVTATSRRWTRGFKQGQRHVQIPAQTFSIDSIVAAFAQHGLTHLVQHEPAFDEPERTLFVRADREAAYEDLHGIPAIYLLKFQKQRSLQIVHARSSAGPTAWNTAPLNLSKSRFADASDAESCVLDLAGYSILPGLINAHDHLEFALFPNLGRSAAEAPYSNSVEWANEIHQAHADVIAKHREVPLGTRLWFGLLRNLLAGVTTVCHHNPLHRELAQPALPVHVIREMGWAHSLHFEPELVNRFLSTPATQPFLLHAAEGVDEASREEFHQLNAQSLLTTNTVLVHGLALNEEDVALLNERGSAFIVCPTSNRFLFGKSPSMDVIQSIQRAALASDSPITATGDLLDEIACLHHQGIDFTTLYRMVTTGAANVLHLREGQGTLALHAAADLIAVRSSYATPSAVLGHLTVAQIELVIQGGRAQSASPVLYEALPVPLRDHLQQVEIEGVVRWVNAPVAELFASAERVLGSGNLRLGNKEVRHRNSL